MKADEYQLLRAVASVKVAKALLASIEKKIKELAR